MKNVYFTTARRPFAIFGQISHFVFSHYFLAIRNVIYLPLAISPHFNQFPFSLSMALKGQLSTRRNDKKKIYEERNCRRAISLKAIWHKIERALLEPPLKSSVGDWKSFCPTLLAKALNVIMRSTNVVFKGHVRGFQIGPMSLENIPVVQRNKQKDPNEPGKYSCRPEEQAKGFWFQWYVRLWSYSSLHLTRI
jgi:hypothetical protein